MLKPILPTTGLVVLALGACQMEPQGPYETGLVVTLESEEERITKSYLQRDGNDPQERKATIGVGDDCDEARASAGQLTTTDVVNVVQQYKVIGQTESSHPLVPGTDTYGKVGVSVVADTRIENGDSETNETFRVPDGDPDAWEETYQYEIGDESAVQYLGVTADEYVVGLTSLGDLWEDLENEDTNIDVDLMTRNNPQAQDIWASLDGNMLYIAVGTEEISIGDEKVSANKVEVYVAGDIDPAGENLVDDCISVENTEFDTTHPDQDDDEFNAAHLDPGCDTDGFVHQQVGTQWWYKNALVQAEILTYEVSITNYGYEWFDVAGDTCFREVSLTKDDSAADLFIEYSVTEIHQVLKASNWAVGE
jgi:hypothetical protein